MALTARFVPDIVELFPNVATTLALRISNADAEARQVAVSLSGDFGEFVRMDSATATIQTNQTVDCVVTALAPSTVGPGRYSLVAELLASDPSADHPVDDRPTASSLAVATVVVVAHTSHTIELTPAQSHGSRRGRHVARIANTGNTVIELGIAAEPVQGDLQVELPLHSVTVDPGAVGEVPICVTPSTTYWDGPTRDHDFIFHAVSGDERSDELLGRFRQHPRVPSWLAAAAAATIISMLVGVAVWFAWLRPWVHDAAADAVERDRAALEERISELGAAADRAAVLPLGRPFDIRLEADPAGGDRAEDGAIVEAGTVYSMTDVVFQNPTGAVGTVSLQRGDEVVLQSELANFRDFDLHFVAPLQFDDDDEIVLAVECRTPGNGASTCPVGATLVGFVDDTD